MAVNEFKITGLADVIQAMEKLPSNINKKVLQSAANAAAQEIVKRSRRNLPPSYTTLKKAITKRKRSERGRFAIRYTVGVTHGKGARYDGWYAHIVEYGSEPHDISPKKSQALYAAGVVMNKRGGAFSQSVHVGGVPATRFMSRTLEDYSQVIDVFVKKGRSNLKALRLKR